jgi:hypothetical protein
MEFFAAVYLANRSGAVGCIDEILSAACQPKRRIPQVVAASVQVEEKSA